MAPLHRKRPRQFVSSYSFERVAVLGRIILLLSPGLHSWHALRLRSGCSGPPGYTMLEFACVLQKGTTSRESFDATKYSHFLKKGTTLSFGCSSHCAEKHNFTTTATIQRWRVSAVRWNDGNRGRDGLFESNTQMTKPSWFSLGIWEQWHTCFRLLKECSLSLSPYHLALPCTSWYALDLDELNCYSFNLVLVHLDHFDTACFHMVPVSRISPNLPLKVGCSRCK